MINLFGWSVVYGGVTWLDRILEYTAREAIEEFSNTVIKESLEAEEDMEIDDKNFTNLLSSLFLNKFHRET